MALPPGQRAVEGFPRFGTHLHQPPPAVPDEPELEICGAGVEAFSLPLAALTKLPRREQVSDFHCVAGWSALSLRWEGVPFAAFYREVIEPALAPGTVVTHVRFHGLDGYWSYATLEDALADDVLLAEQLDGRPLDGSHGAPLRLVSPSQYGFVSAKHVCRIELLTGQPAGGYGAVTTLSRVLLKAFDRHPRARVAEQERHRFLPGWTLLPLFRALTPSIRTVSRRRR